MSDMLKNNHAILCENLSMSFPMEKDSLKKTLDRNFRKFLLKKRENDEYSVFENLNFSVRKGEVFGIIGRNGCGKTTLLKYFPESSFQNLEQHC